MKRVNIFILIISLVSLLLIGSKQEVKAESKYQKFLYLNDYEEVEQIYTGEYFDILKFSDQVKYLYDTEEILIKGKLQEIEIKDSLAFLIIDNKLYKINKKEIEKVIDLPQDYIINDIYYDKLLYLVGSQKDTGIIVEYNDNLVEIKKYELGVDNKLNFLNIVKDKESFYLTATKQGHSINNEFKNIGSFNDTKTIVLKLNDKMNIEDVLYLNNDSSYEKPIFLELKDNKLFFVLRVDETNYYYEVSTDFKECKLLYKKEGQEDILLSVNNEYLNFDTKHTLKIATSKELLEYDINNVIGYNIKDSYLNVFTLENQNIYQYQIEEYHIEYLKEFYLGYDFGNYDFDSDLNNTDVIKVTSYFSKVEVYNQTIFTKNIPGVYDLNLIVKRPNLENITLSTKANVLKYVNVVNEGVYRTGKTLYFMGVGILNNETISNGYTIKEEGNYRLVIKDKYNNSEEYNFSCVDNYYINDDLTYRADYYVFPNSEAKISFTLENNDLVQEVVVNNEIIDFEQNDKTLIFNVNGSSSYGIKEYTINKIKINDKWYVVDQKYIVKTLKQKPTIQIEETDQENLSLKMNVDDLEQTIVKFNIYINDKLQFENYLQNESYSLNEFKNKNIRMKIEVYYDLGDQQMRKEEILYLDSHLTARDNELTFDFNFDTRLNSLTIDLTTNNFKKINTLKVLDIEIKDNYIKKIDYLPLYLSAGITLVIVLIIIGILIRKKSKKKES